MSLEIVNLEKVCKIIAGQSPPSTTYNDKGIGYPFFQGKADFGLINPKVRIWCSAPKKLAQRNDILISVRAPVGPTNICDVEAAIGRGLSAIRAGEKLETFYLLYFLRSYAHILSSKGTGSTFSAITQKDLKQIPIPLPPLETQKRIVDLLDRAQALIDKRKKQIALMDQLIQSLFYDMFGDPVKNPMGWELNSINQICKSIYGGGTPSKKIKAYYTGDIPWVTPKDMKTIQITDSIDKITKDAIKNSSTKLIPSGSILMVIRSGILKRKLPVAINTVDVTLNQDMKAFIPDNSMVLNYYLLYFFSAVQKYLLSKVRAVTADNIEFKQIKELSIPVPSLKLQNTFADRVLKIESQKEAMTTSLRELEDNFNSLMQRAFKGELT